MGKIKRISSIGKGLLGFVFLLAASCTHKVQIEPSDKPFIVNLNVKVDHEIKMQIRDENKDLLNLEDEVLKSGATKPKKSKGGK